MNIYAYLENMNNTRYIFYNTYIIHDGKNHVFNQPYTPILKTMLNINSSQTRIHCLSTKHFYEIYANKIMPKVVPKIAIKRKSFLK